MSAPLLSLLQNHEMHEKQINTTADKCQSESGHLLKCSSYPSSWSVSSSESGTSSNRSLVGKATRAVVALHRQLVTERERSRQLLTELVSTKETGLELVLHRVELEKAENHQLRDIVCRQKRTIALLQQQLKAIAANCNILDSHFSVFDNSCVCNSSLPGTDSSSTAFCSQARHSCLQKSTVEAVRTGTFNERRTSLESRVKEMESIVKQWQVYAEQRDQYARILAQRCAELELIVKKCEQQADVDRALIGQQTTRIETAENENRQLKTKVNETESQLAQTARRLKSQQQWTKAAQEQINVLQTQLVVYKEDFISEQRDRQQAEQRIATLERQLVAIDDQSRRYEPVVAHLQLPGLLSPFPVDALPNVNCNTTTNSGSSSYHDNGFPLLIARGTVGVPSNSRATAINNDELDILDSEPKRNSGC